MPIYEYVCNSCGERFEKLVLPSSREQDLTCPVCESEEIEKALSTFATRSSSPGGVSAAGCCSQESRDRAKRRVGDSR
jgi:putative FmdB family regulatory protein